MNLMLSLFLALSAGGSAQDEVFEWTIATDEEICTIKEFEDENYYGLNPDGEIIGQGTLFSDFARGRPMGRQLNRWKFELPALNPEGVDLLSSDPHPGDPETIIFRYSGKQFRWLRWENTQAVPHTKRVKFTTEFRPWFEYSTAPWWSDDYRVNAGNMQAYFFWDHYLNGTMPLTAFDGTIDADGSSGWQFACGPTMDLTGQGEWCQAGTTDYHSFELTRTIDFDSLPAHSKNALRAGTTMHFKPDVNQYINYDAASPLPASGENVTLHNHHGWAIDWGLRLDMKAKMIVLR